MGDKALKGNKLTKWLTNYAAPWDTDAKVPPELKGLLQGTKKIKTTKRRAQGRK